MTPKPRTSYLLDRKKRLPGRRKAVTICIAAACENSHFIVCVCDMMLSTPTMKVDAAIIKIKKLGRWTALFAGQSGDADLVMDDLQAELLGIGVKSQLRDVAIKAYNRRFGEFSAGRWLAPYGIDMPTFLRDGKKLLTVATFNGLCRQIADDASNFNLEMLLCGWLPGEFTAQIVSMNHDGIYSHTLDGFAAIGSGAEAAKTSLMFQGYAIDLRLARVIGQVCIAKFMAEYSDGVGKITLLSVVSNQEEHHFTLQPYEIERLRDFWKAAGQPRYPDGLDELIWEMIEEKVPTLYGGKH